LRFTCLRRCTWVIHRLPCQEFCCTAATCCSVLDRFCLPGHRLPAAIYLLLCIDFTAGLTCLRLPSPFYWTPACQVYRTLPLHRLGLMPACSGHVTCTSCLPLGTTYSACLTPAVACCCRFLHSACLECTSPAPACRSAVLPLRSAWIPGLLLDYQVPVSFPATIGLGYLACTFCTCHSTLGCFILHTCLPAIYTCVIYSFGITPHTACHTLDCAATACLPGLPPPPAIPAACCFLPAVSCLLGLFSAHAAATAHAYRLCLTACTTFLCLPTISP